MARAFLLLLFVTAMFAAGCGPASNAKKSVHTASPQQIFQVKGVVKEVKPLEKSVIIRHEEVTNYMPAMTMPFDVRDTNELTGLAAGDPVSPQRRRNEPR